jgi:anti-anti-sigma factor
MTLQNTALRRKLECKLAFHVEPRPHFLRVAISGEASFEQAEVISAQLLRILPGPFSLVVLDLAGLTFISSLAMGALVDYRRGLGRRGVEVWLANVQPQVWLALESAGLGPLFPLIDLQEPARRTASAVAWP